MKVWIAAMAFFVGAGFSPSETGGLKPAPTEGSAITLPQIIDVALANNPNTRIAWLQARAAEAALGSERAAYLPEVDLNASLTKSNAGTTFGPSLALTYLLFDFGGRNARVEEARQALIAADFQHNQAIQDVVLQAETAYYDYLDAKALLDAQAATLKERRTSLDAAEARHNAGVATIADVLQARTALSQTELSYETIDGSVHTIEGVLATVMGLPATTRYDYGVLPLDIDTTTVAGAVDALIARAAAERPELAAAKAQAERAQARVREVRATGLPTIGLTSSVGHTFNASLTKNPYNISVGLRFPLFTGGRIAYDVREAQALAAIAGEQVRGIEQKVDLEVWSSYYALQTAAQRLKTSRDLLASAQQSADVARERYKSGVGTILDLLIAQAALETARAQEVQARADWLQSVAQLAHATGSLGPKGSNE